MSKGIIRLYYNGETYEAYNFDSQVISANCGDVFTWMGCGVDIGVTFDQSQLSDVVGVISNFGYAFIIEYRK